MVHKTTISTGEPVIQQWIAFASMKATLICHFNSM
jgi:hypothetical protein